MYSETPPPPGTASTKVDMTPASTGRPNAAPRSRADDPTRNTSARRDPSPGSKEPPLSKAEEAKQKELEMKARCARYGGEDCPDTLTRDPEPTRPYRQRVSPGEIIQQNK